VPPVQDEGGAISINAASELDSRDVSNDWLPILIAEDNANVAEYVDGYRLRLFFNDGTTQVVDFHDYLRDAPMTFPFCFEFFNISVVFLTLKNLF